MWLRFFSFDVVYIRCIVVGRIFATINLILFVVWFSGTHVTARTDDFNHIVLGRDFESNSPVILSKKWPNPDIQNNKDLMVPRSLLLSYLYALKKSQRFERHIWGEGREGS